MIGRKTGSVRLDAHTMKMIVEITRKETSIAEYFHQFLVPGALKSDDGWFNPHILDGDCVCTKQQLNNYTHPCDVCKTHFAANRIASNYIQHKKLMSDL
tara:strand:+ start:376 stop:672 length:297 start_codon:yes stop_codon:yes gene_type:complete